MYHRLNCICNIFRNVPRHTNGFSIRMHSQTSKLFLCWTRGCVCFCTHFCVLAEQNNSFLWWNPRVSLVYCVHSFLYFSWVWKCPNYVFNLFRHVFSIRMHSQTNKLFLCWTPKVCLDCRIILMIKQNWIFVYRQPFPKSISYSWLTYSLISTKSIYLLNCNIPSWGANQYCLLNFHTPSWMQMEPRLCPQSKDPSAPKSALFGCAPSWPSQASLVYPPADCVPLV